MRLISTKSHTIPIMFLKWTIHDVRNIQLATYHSREHHILTTINYLSHQREDIMTRLYFADCNSLFFKTSSFSLGLVEPNQPLRDTFHHFHSTSSITNFHYSTTQDQSIPFIVQWQSRIIQQDPKNILVKVYNVGCRN